jgi:hypothetical protein
MIADYLDKLSAALSFDRSLSRCVREEVEDHLREAVAADPDSDRREAEVRAIARFGDPLVVAAHFVVVSLERRTRRVGAAVMAAIAGIFIMMKARLAWYALTGWPLCDDMQALASTVRLIDAYAFWASLIIGLGGLAYISAFPAAPRSQYRTHVRWFCVMGAAATATLAISIAGDGVLTSLRMIGTDFSAAALVPIASMAVEIACAAALALQIRAILQRLATLPPPGSMSIRLTPP